MGQDPTITLSINESGDRPNSTYLFHVFLDGKPLASNQSLSLSDSAAAREISRTFGTLFERGGCRPEKDAAAQRALGERLFILWLASCWDKILADLPSGSSSLLVIASESPEILNLPWELVLPPGGDFLGIDPRFFIRRLPRSGKMLAPFAGELRPRPLRLLFMACAPVDQPTLDYEREEEALFRAVSGQDVAFDSCDLGTFEELKERVNEFQPHVLHLTGHGTVKDGKGYFAFEKEDGKADLVTADDLRRFLAGSEVQCVFVSGCQSGKAPREALAGVCQALVGAEVPLAVGWAASIADDLATNFARRFYGTLKAGQPVDRALSLARQDAWKTCEVRSDPSWVLPVLYSATNQRMIFDPDQQKPIELPSRPTIIQRALPGMKEGYAEHFVGRRREQQRLLPSLKSGDIDLLILTGLGGSGKSTLATRLARKLETYGFIPIPVSSSKSNPLNSARLLQAFGDAFRKTARKQRTSNAQKADELSALAEDLNNPQIPVESRLHDAVSALNEGHFLLLLDNFESNLDEADLHIQDAEISGFYKYLLENLSGGSRAIITTRYPPSDVSVLPPKVHHEGLSDFSLLSLIKILQRDPDVERRIRSGKLPMSLLRMLHEKFGGTPRFLLQVREVLKEMDADVLENELKNITLPSDVKSSELQKLKDKYFADIITERLFGHLSPRSQKALCRSAVYGVPVTLDGLMAVSQEPSNDMQEFVQNWQDRAFAYQDTEKSKEPLWIVYGLLRSWLLAKLSLEERKQAYKAAGDFLVEMEKQNRLVGLGLSWVDCMMEARSAYLQAQSLGQARDVTDRLSFVFTRSGFYDGVRSLNSKLLEFETLPSPMSWIARTYLHQGDYSSAQSWYRRCLAASSGSNTQEGALALHGLAMIDLNEGDYASALDNFKESLKIFQQLGDRASEASTWHALATIDFNNGDYASAFEKYEKSLKIQQQLGDRTGEASTWHALATIDLNEGDYASALEKYEKSLKMRQQLGDRAGEASTWHALATIDLNEGDYASALEKYEKSLKILEQIGDRAGEAATFHQLGFLSWRGGHAEEGLRLVALSYLINSSIGHEKARLSFENLSDMALWLGYSQDSFDIMLKEVAKSYHQDRGRSLIDAAFPEA